MKNLTILISLIVFINLAYAKDEFDKKDFGIFWRLGKPFKSVNGILKVEIDNNKIQIDEKLIQQSYVYNTYELLDLTIETIKNVTFSWQSKNSQNNAEYVYFDKMEFFPMYKEDPEYDVRFFCPKSKSISIKSNEVVQLYPCDN